MNAYAFNTIFVSSAIIVCTFLELPYAVIGLALGTILGVILSEVLLNE